MSGVLRRGTLNFDLDSYSKRGSVESNLYGGYRDGKESRTPEISIISLDFRRHSEDLKKDSFNVNNEKETNENQRKNLSDDVDSDIISNYIGHYGKWNFIWTFILSLFQIIPTFQMFAFVFQVSHLIEEKKSCLKTNIFFTHDFFMFYTFFFFCFLLQIHTLIFICLYIIDI